VKTDEKNNPDKTYPLTIGDRLMLLQTLPAEGDIITIRILRDLKTRLGITEAEHQELGIIVSPDGRVQWQAEKDKPKDISIGKVARAIINEALTKLNDNKKLTEAHLNIWDLFHGDD